VRHRWAFIDGTQIILRANNVECHLQTPRKEIAKRRKRRGEGEEKLRENPVENKQKPFF